MARVNPDPYRGGHLFALVNRVTALLDTEDEAKAIVRVLEQEGVATDDIDIFTGEEGAKRLDLPGREHGIAVRLARMLEASMGDEAAANHRIDAALNRGGTLLCVKVHNNRKGEEKARALRILKTLHAHDIHFWGAWGREDVPEGPEDCVLCSLSGDRIMGENEHAVWVLDKNPVSPGHSLIVTKRHVESFFEMPMPEREAILSLLDKAREHASKKHAPEGFNIGINEGPAAGSSVPHLHVHLIPRFFGDRKDPRGGVRWVIPDKADYWSHR